MPNDVKDHDVKDRDVFSPGHFEQMMRNIRINVQAGGTPAWAHVQSTDTPTELLYSLLTTQARGRDVPALERVYTLGEEHPEHTEWLKWLQSSSAAQRRRRIARYIARDIEQILAEYDVDKVFAELDDFFSSPDDD